MYEVGQEILNGQVVVATIDTNGLILSVTLPQVTSQGGEPLTITYNFGVTEMFVANILSSVPGA